MEKRKGWKLNHWIRPRIEEVMAILSSGRERECKLENVRAASTSTKRVFFFNQRESSKKYSISKSPLL
jgi:hypothetical protein